MKRNILLVSILLSFTAASFSFDWPQEEVESDHFHTYFGQLRGGTISSSLVFAHTETVKAAEDGTLLIEMNNDDETFFPSTLGSCIILQHKDNIQTVYANLDSDSFSSDLKTREEFEKGTPLAQVTNSGWQDGKSALEFQVIDTKKHTVINPRILLPRFGKEPELSIRGVTLVGKKGEFRLSQTKYIDSGTYLVYRERQNTAIPFKSVVFVNGAVNDSISWGLLKCEKGKLYIPGKKNYDLNAVYPDDKKALIGEITLSKGFNQIRITVSDINGTEKTALYNIEAK